MGQGAERCRNEAEAALPYRYLFPHVLGSDTEQTVRSKIDPVDAVEVGTCGSHTHARRSLSCLRRRREAREALAVDIVPRQNTAAETLERGFAASRT